MPPMRASHHDSSFFGSSPFTSSFLGSSFFGPSSFVILSAISASGVRTQFVSALSVLSVLSVVPSDAGVRERHRQAVDFLMGAVEVSRDTQQVAVRPFHHGNLDLVLLPQLAAQRGG